MKEITLNECQKQQAESRVTFTSELIFPVSVFLP